MLKTLAAVVGAAACAGMMVALIPPPEPAVAARTPQSSVADAGKLAVAPAPRRSDIRKPVCTQSWPYYEQSCLSDVRQPNGKARSVRVIAAAITATKRSVHARR